MTCSLSHQEGGCLLFFSYSVYPEGPVSLLCLTCALKTYLLLVCVCSVLEIVNVSRGVPAVTEKKKKVVLEHREVIRSENVDFVLS